MVNPFDLTTHNMTRIDPFNLFMPRRVFFEIKESLNKDQQPSLRSKLLFNDYLLYFENQDESKRRIQDALALSPVMPMQSFEHVDSKEVEKILIKNIPKA